MHHPGIKRALGFTLGLVLAGAGVLACGNDFDVFESGAGAADAATAADGQAGDGSTTTVPGSDGSTTPPGDAAPQGDGAVDPCATKASCGTTQTSCKTTCDQTATTCTAACAPGGAGKDCKDACNNTKDNCRSTCESTCRSCAGAACNNTVCR